jgi:hypothetical protein
MTGKVSMKIHKVLFLLIIVLIFAGCNPLSTDTKAIESHQLPVAPTLIDASPSVNELPPDPTGTPMLPGTETSSPSNTADPVHNGSIKINTSCLSQGIEYPYEIPFPGGIILENRLSQPDGRWQRGYFLLTEQEGVRPLNQSANENGIFSQPHLTIP